MIRKTENTVITNYVYNEEDRLIEVRDGSNILIASYYYDPFGRRLWKEVGEVKTCFAYADEGLVGEYNATGAEIRSYGYRPGSTWTTDPLFMKENGTYYFYQNDHLGTPQKLTASNGAIVWSAIYQSFGKARVDIETVENNLRFPGQYYDEETGLHYNYFRYYDPGTGRFITTDPIEFQGGVNWYSYVFNNAVNFFDSLGLKTYMCTAPLHVLGGSGSKSGPDIWGNPFYHKYLCTKTGNTYTCGGQDRTGDGPWYVPWSSGKPSNDTYNEKNCKEVASDNKCIENCLLNKFKEPRPRYSIGPLGTDCQEWADNALKECKSKCNPSKECKSKCDP